MDIHNKYTVHRKLIESKTDVGLVRECFERYSSPDTIPLSQLKTNKSVVNMTCTHLKSYDIYVAELVPLGWTVVVVPVEPHPQVIADGVGEQPREVILEPHQEGGIIQIPEFVQQAGVLQEVVVFYRLQGVHGEEFDKDDDANHWGDHFLEHRHQGGRFYDHRSRVVVFTCRDLREGTSKQTYFMQQL